jgi:CRP/FNR family transcriptional regulator
MLILGRKTAREKIASLLSTLVQRERSLAGVSTEDGVSFELPLTREAMADYLGVTLETVSRQISALKKEGVIVLEGSRHIRIPDLDRLRQEAGDDSCGV